MNKTAFPLIFCVVACSDPAAGKPAATVADEPPPAVQAPAPKPDEQPAEAQTLALVPATSRVEMVGSKVTGSHDIKVKEFKGDVALAKDAPLESAEVTVVMQMASIEADHPKLTKHLLSGDFFEVEKHPTATFKSTGVKQGGGEGATHTVTGDLTLRGVTKRVSFPATITRQGETVKAKAEFSIDRKDFGINYPGMPDDLIRDDVLIKLDLTAS